MKVKQIFTKQLEIFVFFEGKTVDEYCCLKK